MSEQNEREADRMSDEAAQAVSSLYGLGLLWARHGLRVGTAALQTSARTLEVCAGTLTQLSESLRERDRG